MEQNPTEENESPKSNGFGVTSILGDDASILYLPLFNTQHLGKISDLISAYLSNMSGDEFQFRTCLSIMIFEGLKLKRELELGQSKPLVFEYGIDKKASAFSITFTVGKEMLPETNGLSDRITQGIRSTQVEEAIYQLYQVADQVFVKYQPPLNKLEILAYNPFEKSKEKNPVKVILFEQEEEVPSLPAKFYLNLGDLDFKRILSEEPQEEDEEDGGEEADLDLWQGPNRRSQEGAELVVGKKRKKARKKEVKVEKESARSNRSVEKLIETSSTEGEIDVDSQTVHSGVEEEDSEFVIEGDRPARESRNFRIISGENQEAEEDENSKRSLRTYTSIDQSPEEGAESKAPLEELPESERYSQLHLDSTRIIEQELEAGRLSKIIVDMKDQVSAALEKLGPTGVQKWIEDQLGRALEERTRLVDLTRKMGQLIQAKEIEYKRVAFSLREEAKRKNVLLTQKESVIQEMRSQLTDSQERSEKFKDSLKLKADLEVLREKYDNLQKTVIAVKKDNHQLTKTLEQTQAQLQNRPLDPTKGGPSMTDFKQLKDEFEKSSRQVEEFRRVNRTLMDRLNEANRNRNTSGTNEETEAKLEAAIQVAAGARREADEFKVKYSALYRQDTQLRAELTRLYAEIKKIKKGLPTSGNEGASGSSAPNNAA